MIKKTNNQYDSEGTLTVLPDAKWTVFKFFAYPILNKCEYCVNEVVLVDIIKNEELK